MTKEEKLSSLASKRSVSIIFLITLLFTVYYWTILIALGVPGWLLSPPNRYFFLLYLEVSSSSTVLIPGIYFGSAMILAGFYNGWYISKSLTIRLSRWSVLYFSIIMIVGFGIGIHEFNTAYSIFLNLSSAIAPPIPNPASVNYVHMIIKRMCIYGAFYTECLMMLIGSLIFSVAHIMHEGLQ